MNLNEIWKPVVGYEGLYEVSNKGNVRGLDRIDKIGRLRRGTELKKEKINTGHLRITLYKDGKPDRQFIHRLVAKAFIPNPLNFPCVNHKDENPENNCVYNLEWCTVEYNNNYGTRNQRIADYNKKPVSQYENGVLVRTLKSATDFEKYGFDCKQISAVLKGKHKTHKGFVFQYA